MSRSGATKWLDLERSKVTVNHFMIHSYFQNAKYQNTKTSGWISRKRGGMMSHENPQNFGADPHLACMASAEVCTL